MNKHGTIVDGLIIPHRAYKIAAKQIEQYFKFAESKTEAEGLAIIGESRTGKTSVLQQFASKHPRIHTQDGWQVPVLFASIPSAPTVKSLAEVLLEAIGVPDPGCGTVNDKTRRLRVLMKEIGTLMVMIDEFQHFVEWRTQRVMHHVADWLKRLIDDTQATIVIAGLPSCMAVMDQNAQLAGRFSAPIVMPRFRWEDPGDRRQFCAILRSFGQAISEEQFAFPDLSENQMEFRFFAATGGLMGYLVKLFRQVLRDCADRGDRRITMEDLHVAQIQSIWATHRNPDLPKPFDSSFQAGPTPDMLRALLILGTATESAPMNTRRGPVRVRPQRINDLLVAR